ncbi:type II toxin-antitoxin system mRNA interferase toxin, RelE/StbE family [bacterium]|nr:type II toxin-antitoxin system mRNA interferase toxin, RelE/StbE family [bacterium]
MGIVFTTRFLRLVKKMSVKEQKKVLKLVEIFEKNPKDRSLKVHKLQGKLAGAFALSVEYDVRILFSVEDDEILFFDIGSHDDVYR